WTGPGNEATELPLIRGAAAISLAYDRSLPVGLERVRLQEAEERRRLRRERPVAVIDGIEVAGEDQPPHRDRGQLARGELSIDRRAGDERRPEPTSDGILDGRVAPHLQRDRHRVERRPDPFEPLPQGTAGARAGLADDERLAGEHRQR